MPITAAPSTLGQPFLCLPTFSTPPPWLPVHCLISLSVCTIPLVPQLLSTVAWVPAVLPSCTPSSPLALFRSTHMVAKPSLQNHQSQSVLLQYKDPLCRRRDPARHLPASFSGFFLAFSAPGSLAFLTFLKRAMLSPTRIPRSAWNLPSLPRPSL